MLKSRQICIRCFSTSVKYNVARIFDRNAKRCQRERQGMMEDFKKYDYLKNEVGWRVFDRICDIKRFFPLIVELSAGHNYVSQYIQEDQGLVVLQTDLTSKLLRQNPEQSEILNQQLVHDEEQFPMFKPNSIDLFVSSLSMHWVNDLPGVFKALNLALVPDGVFIGSIFAGDTLFELRVSLQQAELELYGGVASHISPFTSVQDLGDILHRSGYTLVTIDVDEIQVLYPGIWELMGDLRAMGESNCSYNRPLNLKRAVIKKAEEYYMKNYANKDNHFPATFQIINWIGWKPDPSQAQPAPRGSGKVSLKDIPNLDEIIENK